MKEKILWGAIALLLLLNLGQAYYIFSRPQAAPERTAAAQPAAEPDPWKELETWRKAMNKRVQAGDPLAAADFDGFFNDSFFRRRFSAFEQMERIHRQMLQAFAEPQRGAFGESWDKWFAERMEMGGFKTRLYSGKNEIVMFVDIPGLEKAKSDISVTKDRVRLAFSAETPYEKNTATGTVWGSSSQSYVKILPVPEGADGTKARISVFGESLRIIFPRLPS